MTDSDMTDHDVTDCVLHLLIVDDDPGMRFMMTEFAAALGHQAHAVDSGHACLAALLTPGFSADALLMDINMPGMSGIELARAIRGIAVPTLRNIPIVAVTANTDLRAEDAPDLMMAVLHKPVDLMGLEQMLDMIVAMLGATGLAQQ
ncbi:MAG: response regulator [Paracoccaceae bacterium]